MRWYLYMSHPEPVCGWCFVWALGAAGENETEGRPRVRFKPSQQNSAGVQLEDRTKSSSRADMPTSSRLGRPKGMM